MLDARPSVTELVTSWLASRLTLRPKLHLSVQFTIMLSTNVGAALKRVVGFTLITVIALAILKRFVNTVHALATPGITSTSQGSKPGLEIQPKLSGVSATYQNGFGIIADIRNTSSVPVWLRPTWVTLTPPPELQPN